MIDTAQLTADQVEALIQFSHNPGSRGLSNPSDDTESRVELEAYVISRGVESAAA